MTPDFSRVSNRVVGFNVSKKTQTEYFAVSNIELGRYTDFVKLGGDDESSARGSTA